MKIIIEAEFGSDWQKEIQPTSIKMMVQAWKAHMESAHKKNKCKITIEEEE